MRSKGSMRRQLATALSATTPSTTRRSFASRQLGDSGSQERHRFLRDALCPLSTRDQYARATAHVGCYSALQLCSMIAFLNGHVKISGTPRVSKHAAEYQIATGTTANPGAHVLPCAVRLNGISVPTFLASEEARQEHARIAGRVVRLRKDYPSHQDWKAVSPAIKNRGDRWLEGFRRDNGAVSVFVQTVSSCVEQSGPWAADGQRQLNVASCTEMIYEVFHETWLPGTRFAYSVALDRLNAHQKRVARSYRSDRDQELQNIEAMEESLESGRSEVLLISSRLGSMATDAVAAMDVIMKREKDRA